MNIKITKTEKDFLIRCLSDEHDIAQKDLRVHRDSDSIVKDLNSKIKISKSILDKLTITKR